MAAKKNKPKKLETRPFAEFALRLFDASNAKYINGWIERIRNWDSDAYVHSHAHALKDLPGSIYVLPTKRDIWIFFQIEGDTVTLLDFGNRAAILAFGGKNGAK